jgi:hypothetical protein
VLNVLAVVLSPLVGLAGIFVGYVLSSRRENRNMRRELALALQRYREGQELFDELISELPTDDQLNAKPGVLATVSALAITDVESAPWTGKAGVQRSKSLRTHLHALGQCSMLPTGGPPMRSSPASI